MKRTSTFGAVASLVLLAGWSLAGGAGQEAERDEARALVAAAIANQHKNDAALAEYERRERKQEFRREEDVQAKVDRTYRVVPTGTGTLRLVVEEGGRPVAPEFYQKQLRDLEQALEWALRPTEPKQRQRVEKWNRRVRERRELVDAVAEAFLFSTVGRESRNGRTLVRIAFVPNPAFRPRAKNSDLFPHVRGTMWLDAEAAQLVRVEAEVISDIAFAGGMGGKIYRGGRFVMEQAPVANGVWLPTRYEYHFQGRKFIFGFELHEVTTASSYRRVGPPAEALAMVRRELNTGGARGSAP